MSREGWRRLPSNRAGAGRQLALSESLLHELHDPSLYWYQATHPALILGAAQKLPVLDLAACRKAELEVYKRTSGGTVVLAGADLVSLDVALPPFSQLASHDITLAYRWFAEVWIAALARLGVSARLVEPEEARAARLKLEAAPPEARLVKLVCFGTLSSYEVVAEDGRKLVGLAQVRRRNGSLLQAGIHLHWPAADFTERLALLDEQRESLTVALQQRAVGLDQLLGRRPSLEEISRVWEESLLENWPVDLEPKEWEVSELKQAEIFEREKFGNLI